MRLIVGMEITFDVLQSCAQEAAKRPKRGEPKTAKTAPESTPVGRRRRGKGQQPHSPAPSTPAAAEEVASPR